MTFVVQRINAVAAYLIDDLLEGRDHVAVAEGEDGIEVHGRPAPGHQASDHSGRGFVAEEFESQLADSLIRGALTKADEHHAVSDRHHVATLDRCAGKV